MNLNTNIGMSRRGFARLAVAWLLACITAGGGLLAAGAKRVAPPRTPHTKSIEDVRVGDYVLAKDSGKSGPALPHRVVALPRNWTEHIVHVRVQGGGELQATREHPFWVAGRGWTAAQELHSGDRLQDECGRAVAVADVLVEERTADTYNLTVEGVHTFYVTAGNSNVLVHNADALGQTYFPWFDPRPDLTLYRKNDLSGNLSKWGVTSQSPITARYPGIQPKQMIALDRGPAGEMLAKERFLESTLPGPQNNTPWAKAAKARGGTPVDVTVNGKPLPCP